MTREPRFVGPQGKGAMRQHREKLRMESVERGLKRNPTAPAEAPNSESTATEEKPKEKEKAKDRRNRQRKGQSRGTANT